MLRKSNKKRGRKKLPDVELLKFERLPAGVSNPIDVQVGNRLRRRRTLMGLSQEKLGEAVGLTFQQIQKYERGANRMGASRLYEFSRILDIPVSYFFEDIEDAVAARGIVGTSGFSSGEQEPLDMDPMAKRETLELVRNYYKITDSDLRRKIFELTRSLARSSLNID